MSGTPMLRVVRGTPTAEELAVLAAVVSAAGDGTPAPDRPPLRGRWNDPARAAHASLHAGPGAWRAAVR